MGGDADSQLAEFIGRVRKLGGLATDAAKLAAPLVEKAVKATADAGTTPDGAAWAPRKRDGGRALVNAAKALSAKAVGASVVVTLKGVEVIHNFARGRIPARQILPDGGAGIPKNVAAAVDEASALAFTRIMRGG
jgi:hypothetical protein